MTKGSHLVDVVQSRRRLQRRGHVLHVLGGRQDPRQIGVDAIGWARGRRWCKHGRVMRMVQFSSTDSTSKMGVKIRVRTRGRRRPRSPRCYRPHLGRVLHHGRRVVAVVLLRRRLHLGRRQDRPLGVDAVLVLVAVLLLMLEMVRMRRKVMVLTEEDIVERNSRTGDEFFGRGEVEERLARRHVVLAAVRRDVARVEVLGVAAEAQLLRQLVGENL